MVNLYCVNILRSFFSLFFYSYSIKYFTGFFFSQPGDSKSVKLVSIGGKRVIKGGNGIVDGPVDDAKREEVLEALSSGGFGNKEEENARFRLYTLQINIACFAFVLL